MKTTRSWSNSIYDHRIMRKRLEDELGALREQDQFRELSIPAGIDLGSNDYLGLSTDSRLKDAIVRAVTADRRVASTGSRLLSGNAERWEELEAEFAQFAGTEAALYFPSGYAANIGVLTSVLKRTDTVFSDSSNHASIIDGIRLSFARKVVFPHLDLEYLEKAMKRTAGEKVVVVESVFSMEGDRAPLADLVALCNRYEAALIVDEAHSVGVDGPQGRGMIAAIGRSETVLATIHTCGKALASMGAFVAGSRTLHDFLVNRARTFIFTTALPPYCAAHIQQALKLAREADPARVRLKELSEYLRQNLNAVGFETGKSDSQIIPLILGSNEAALRFAASVASAGFAIRAIRPPTVPAGTARLRLSLNAKLSFANLDAVTEALVAARDNEVVRK
jgi:8-amino-7-oxononanoate synthase